MGLFQCDANFLFWFHIHKLSKQTNVNFDWTKCDQIYQIDHQIIFAHSWSHTDLLITRFFLCHSSFELYFYALEFLLIFFLHLILFLHSLVTHTHIVHICNYFPSIDVNKNHSIKQNKKKDSIRISNVYRFWANAFSRVWILLDIVLSVCRRFSQFGSLPLFFWYKNKKFNSLYFHWYRFHGDLKMFLF